MSLCAARVYLFTSRDSAHYKLSAERNDMSLSSAKITESHYVSLRKNDLVWVLEH